MNKFAKFYVKHIIKNPIIFLSFLTLMISIFLYITLTIKLDVVKTFDVLVSNNDVFINTNYDSDTVYLYSNKNENIYKILDCDYENNTLSFNITDDEMKNLDLNNLKADIVIFEETLLKRIFTSGGRGHE